MMRTMGLDVGKKTIGVAVSDEDGIIAQPLTTIRRTGIRKDLDELVRLIKEHQAGEIVVGMPVNLDGTMSEQGKKTASFIKKLEQRTDIPIKTWDERMSTAAVERLLIEGDVTREKRKKVVDKMAASYILQGYLDGKRDNE